MTNLQQHVQALSIEKDDLFSTYQRALKDLQQKTADIAALQVYHSEGSQRVAEIARVKDDLEGKLRVFQSLEQQWSYEKDQLMRQMDNLNDQRVALERQVKGLTDEHDKVVRELYTAKQTNGE